MICCKDNKETKDIIDNKHIEVKQLSDISTYLGIEVERTTEGGFLLSQKNKVMDFVNSLDIKTTDGVGTPLDTAYMS